MRGVAGVLALTLSLSLVQGGCSFTVQGPPARVAVGGARPVCDENADLRLTVDGLFGSAWGLAAIGGGAVLIANEGDDEAQGLSDFGGALILAGSLMAVLHWSALFVGRDRARACRAAMARFRDPTPAE